MNDEYRERLFESSPLPIVVMDAETYKYVDCNRSAVSIYRYPSKEAVFGKTPMDFSALVQYDGTPSPEKAIFYINKALQEGSVVFEWKHQRPDGEFWDAEVHLLSFTVDNRQLLQFSLVDITERKQAAQTLQHSEHRFRSLFENAEISIWNEDLSEVRKALDKLRLDGVRDIRRYLVENRQAAWDMADMVKVTHVNEATLRLFGAKNQEEMLRKISTTFGANTIEVLIDEICAIWDNQKTFRSEADYRTLDGKELKTIISFLIPETEEEYRNLPVCIIDITELKKAEEIQRKLDQAKSTFISTVAHELRTPLIAIVGYSELLENKSAPLSEEQKRDYNTIIQSNVEVLNRLVDDLLDIGRIQIGHSLGVTPRETDPAPIIKKASESATILSRKRKILIEHNNPLAKTLWIDGDRISQVLNNLLSNAIKYSPEESTVKVQTMTDEEKVTVSILDQGVGMTPQQIEHIYDRFYRAESSSLTNTGLGLGMTIVKQIIADHGGEISISSSPGEGTTVAFTLPRRLVS